MQFVYQAKHDYKSVTHVDGTSRVQVVKDDGSNMRKILECWYDVTGCPMLLNTSFKHKRTTNSKYLGRRRRFYEKI